jgi:hypothetical protein
MIIRKVFTLNKNILRIFTGPVGYEAQMRKEETHKEFSRVSLVKSGYLPAK